MASAPRLVRSAVECPTDGGLADLLAEAERAAEAAGRAGVPVPLRLFLQTGRIGPTRPAGVSRLYIDEGACGAASVVVRPATSSLAHAARWRYGANSAGGRSVETDGVLEDRLQGVGMIRPTTCRRSGSSPRRPSFASANEKKVRLRRAAGCR